MQKRSVFALALAAATVAALTGCSAGSAADDGKVRVVASTNVYGDIASTIAGDAVEVTALMSDPAQDPHSFEASAQSQLAVSKADILIENGGGYDDFMDTLRTGSKNTRATVLNVVDLSGKKAAGGDLNEHVWYDFPTIQKLTTALAAALSKADPAQKATFAKNAEAFSAKLAALQNREAELKAGYAGAGSNLGPSRTANAMDDILIEELELGVRSYNCLKRAGIQTVGDLISKTEGELNAIPNFGKKSIDEVIETLHGRGLGLRNE